MHSVEPGLIKCQLKKGNIFTALTNSYLCLPAQVLFPHPDGSDGCFAGIPH